MEGVVPAVAPDGLAIGAPLTLQLDIPDEHIPVVTPGLETVRPAAFFGGNSESDWVVVVARVVAWIVAWIVTGRVPRRALRPVLERAGPGAAVHGHVPVGIRVT